MLTDLGLGTDSVPLFVGETLRQDQGGACYGHNTQVARMPSVVKNSYVISSEGCPGNGTDPWHFNALGYRMMGSRYAGEALYTLEQHLPYFSFHNYMVTLNDKSSYVESTRTFTATGGVGIAGWTYPHFADWSSYKYLVVKLKNEADSWAEVMLYGKNKSIAYRDTINGRKTMVIDLNNLSYRNIPMDPAKVYKMVFRWPKDTKIVIDDIFLSNDEDEYGAILAVENHKTTNGNSRTPIHSLDGRVVKSDALKPGVYISNGKKILSR